MTVNPIKHNTALDNRQWINAILYKTEKDVVEVLTSHYNNPIPKIDVELERLDGTSHPTCHV